MIPFGLLSGFMDSKEIRITELGEDGFRFRLTEECPEPEQFRICFYDMKKAGYRKVEIRKFEMNAVAGTLEAEERCVQENDGSFFREYSVRVEQKDYVQEVQRLAKAPECRCSAKRWCHPGWRDDIPRKGYEG